MTRITFTRRTIIETVLVETEHESRPVHDPRPVLDTSAVSRDEIDNVVSLAAYLGMRSAS